MVGGRRGCSVRDRHNADTGRDGSRRAGSGLSGFEGHQIELVFEGGRENEVGNGMVGDRRRMDSVNPAERGGAFESSRSAEIGGLDREGSGLNGVVGAFLPRVAGSGEFGVGDLGSWPSVSEIGMRDLRGRQSVGEIGMRDLGGRPSVDLRGRQSVGEIGMRELGGRQSVGEIRMRGLGSRPSAREIGVRGLGSWPSRDRTLNERDWRGGMNEVGTDGMPEVGIGDEPEIDMVEGTATTRRIGEIGSLASRMSAR
ncbi:PREDICTED: uncharacterized protein LOC109126845 [Camelina sativa]|uniref:Uncharacterized protein LOC109126845 n=1 Tax=Camelina sativa TaxID=90675 RepID=A0ABM1QHM5_CAMSA|nr:PREDICTED: uncharacterized protein LOC109126845 [Camelina sativa]